MQLKKSLEACANSDNKRWCWLIGSISEYMMFFLGLNFLWLIKTRVVNVSLGASIAEVVSAYPTAGGLYTVRFSLRRNEKLYLMSPIRLLLN